MKRHLRGGAWLAILLLAATTGAGVSAQSTEGWGLLLKAEGWTYLGTATDNSVIAFLKLPVVRSPQHFPRVWVRDDYSTPQTARDPPFRSLMDFYEVDCSAGRARVLQEQTYQGNNLEGSIVSSTTIPDAWTYAGPGTINNHILKVVCGKP